MNATNKNIAEKGLKGFVIYSTAVSILITFLATVHFNLETRVSIIEAQTTTNNAYIKEQIESINKKLERWNENVIKLIIKTTEVK